MTLKPPVTPADIAREIVAKTREEIARRVDPIEAKLAAPTAPVEAVVDVRTAPMPPVWRLSSIERDPMGYLVGATLTPQPTEGRRDPFEVIDAQVGDLAGMVKELAQRVVELGAQVQALQQQRSTPRAASKGAQASLPLLFNGSGH